MYTVSINQEQNVKMRLALKKQLHKYKNRPVLAHMADFLGDAPTHIFITALENQFHDVTSALYIARYTFDAHFIKLTKDSIGFERVVTGKENIFNYYITVNMNGLHSNLPSIEDLEQGELIIPPKMESYPHTEFISGWELSKARGVFLKMIQCRKTKKVKIKSIELIKCF